MTEPDPATEITEAQRDGAVYRMATLVARGTSPDALTEAMAEELERLSLCAELPSATPGPADRPLGQRAERLLETFKELRSIAVGVAQERASAARLEREQRAVRSVATLVARGASADQVFAAVTRAAGEVLGADFAALGRSAPRDGEEYVASWARSGVSIDLPDLRRLTAGTTAISTPVMVDGRPWGALTVFVSGDHSLSRDAPERLAAFTELLGPAVGTVTTREHLTRAVNEEAALRRVATLVAAGSEPHRVFAAVTEEVGRLLDADLAALGRVDEDNSTFDVVTTWGRSGDPAPRGRTTLGGDNVVSAAVSTGAPARQSHWAAATGTVGEIARSLGLVESVAVPIVVQGSVWGVIVVSAAGSHSLPTDAEVRLASFNELVAAAIANAESRDELAASRARIVAAADDARARIERDLQDGVQQRLVSLGLSLRTAVTTVEGSEEVELKATLDRLIRGFADAYADLQEIARGIHPAVLTEGGLRPAVSALARRSPIPVRIDIPELPRLSDQLEAAAFYAASEALTNAIKHGQPSAVKIVAGLDEGVLRLSVQDDGVGGADLSAGSGLLGLRDRIETLSGEMTVTSPPGAGTRISISIPV